LLPPLILLLLGRSPLDRVARTVAYLLIVVQAGIALAVQMADYEYADSYRDWAQVATESFPDQTIWYVGHWGWKFYAEEQGFEMVHRDGPLPRSGDIVLWPAKVHVGDVFSGNEELREGLELLEATVYVGAVPLRTMSIPAGAGFYAVIRGRLPYRLFSNEPLESMRVFQMNSR
jgi:hypothetical protein